MKIRAVGAELCNIRTDGRTDMSTLTVTYRNFANAPKTLNNFSQLFSLIHSFIPLPRAEFDDSLPFSGASSIPLCYIPFPSTLFHHPVFQPPSLHLAIYFLIYLSTLLFPNSYVILFLGIQFSSIL
jgi:hypothetical protein